MRRERKQLGFADHFVAQSGSARGDWLVAVDRLVDWAAVDRLLEPIHAAPTGRPGYAPLVLLKAALLQRWHALGDEEAEHAIGDRLSFRRFLGLPLETKTPDHVTLWRFRQELASRGLAEAVFAEIGRQLAMRGMIVRQGTLIDASLVKSAAAEPPVQPGGGSSAVDREARWAKKGKKAVFGYKLHIAVDAGSHLVRAARLTRANVNDCVLGPELVQGDERAVYADMAYQSARMRARLAAAGVADCVMQRPNRHHRELGPGAVARNKAIARIRGPVEGVFGTLKRRYRMDRLPYFTRLRNEVAVLLAFVAMNLRRAVVLSS